MIKPIKITEEELKVNEGDISDIEISKEDISKAVDKLKKNSAAASDDVPEVFLINTKECIKLPLKIILRKSMDEGKKIRCLQIGICDSFEPHQL